MQYPKDVMLTLKSDGFIEGQPPILMSQWIARTIHQQISKLPFAPFFHRTTILVPVPSSSLMRPGTLWVPERIASALVKMGMGREVVACLVRTTALRKAARTDPSERPKPQEHIDTISVQSQISEQPNEILLVDDIVTRGATLLGAANRLAEVFPGAQVRGFAAMRTISDPSDFVATYEPCSGTIQYRERTGDTLRRP
jgi:predicted amidophosphoribosyltransferase